MIKISKTVNAILIVSFIASIIISILLYKSVSNQLGDIKYISGRDDPNFDTQAHIYQYYQSNPKYKGERKGIRKEIFLKDRDVQSLKNGYITARFILNSKGQTDRYRLKAVDNNYQKNQVTLQDSQKIISQLKILQNWIPGNVKNKKVDSYVQINFKIHDGKIIDIF
ncbi:hypothetical protein EIB75_05550 [Epilithonimonas vandammei]|uniref:Energy transducer TonB n=1 Tax=Epilithonimonas vandammei TaxID=2487072 RepID=A0A3G8ZDR4_9FLAO|nr:hypothetical protein [Epilithonimonas vandammei]AZI54747.1 hypothetical protein EIB75_05550 [Epilithonimonas vandammei]